MKIYSEFCSDEVIYESDNVRTIRELVEKAVKEGVDLTRANLREANLREAYLAKANLFKANLKGTNLSKANLFGTNLSGACLSGVNLNNSRKYRKITKKKAHSLTKELWIWLKENKSFNKSDWPYWEKHYEIWSNLRGSDCFLCIRFECKDCILVPRCSNYYDEKESAWRKFCDRNPECYDEIINVCT